MEEGAAPSSSALTWHRTSKWEPEECSDDGKFPPAPALENHPTTQVTVLFPSVIAAANWPHIQARKLGKPRMFR